MPKYSATQKISLTGSLLEEPLKRPLTIETGEILDYDPLDKEIRFKGVICQADLTALIGNGTLTLSGVSNLFDSESSAGTPYTPANSADWSPVPDDAAEALDQLAANKLSLTGGTIDGTLITKNDNITSFRLAGKDFNGLDVQTYGGIFYNNVYDSTGGLGAKKSRMILGGNEDLAVEIQSSNVLRLTAIDDIVGGGTIRLAAADKIDFHVGGLAETDALVAKIDTNGAELLGTLITEKDNATSFRLKGKDFSGSTVQTYAGIFYNNVYGDDIGGNKKSRMIIGGNEDLSVEIQSSNDLRLTAVDDIIGGGKVRIASNNNGIEFHVGGLAETDAMIAKIDTNGLTMQTGAALTLASDPSGALQATTKQYTDNNFQLRVAGTNANRPIGPLLGQMYFETDLGANGTPIWWNGTNWVDSASNIV